jgi:hypothetical protein
LDGTYGGVIGWFNRRGLYLNNSTGNQTTTATAPSYIAAPGTLNALYWGDELPFVKHDSQASTTANFAHLGIGLDGTATEVGPGQYVNTGTPIAPCGIGGWGNPLSEGFHYWGVIGYNGTAGTLTSNNGILSAMIRG